MIIVLPEAHYLNTYCIKLEFVSSNNKENLIFNLGKVLSGNGLSKSEFGMDGLCTKISP